jgi:hypothetical protein
MSAAAAMRLTQCGSPRSTANQINAQLVALST